LIFFFIEEPKSDILIFAQLSIKIFAHFKSL